MGDFSQAIEAQWAARAKEDADRYAVQPGERKRVLGELSPFQFRGRSLNVEACLDRGVPEQYALSLGRLRVAAEAYYGRLSWILTYDDGEHHFLLIASKASYHSGEWTPAQCMRAAEEALAEFQAQVAAL